VCYNTFQRVIIVEIYDSGKVIEFENALLYDEGYYGEVYKDGDLMIKKYMSERSDYYDRLSPAIFDILSDISSPAFINLIDSFKTKVRLFPDDYDIDMLTGYTSEFIETRKGLMVDLPMEYTLHTLYEFRKLLKILNDNNILIADTNRNNSIVGFDNLVIIDPDCYEFNEISCDIEKENMESINRYLLSKWVAEMRITDKAVAEKIREKLFDYEKGDYLDVMSKRLRAKTPRDVINRIRY